MDYTLNYMYLSNKLIAGFDEFALGSC